MKFAVALAAAAAAVLGFSGWSTARLYEAGPDKVADAARPSPCPPGFSTRAVGAARDLGLVTVRCSSSTRTFYFLLEDER